MKSILLIGLFCCMAMTTHAQHDGIPATTDSSRSARGFFYMLFHKGKKLRSAVQQTKRIDDSLSLQTTIDTLKDSAVPKIVNSIQDSISGVAKHAEKNLHALTTIHRPKRALPDSIPVLNQFDSLKARLMSEADRFNGPDSLLDNLRSKVAKYDLPDLETIELPSHEISTSVEDVLHFDTGEIVLPTEKVKIDNIIPSDDLLDVDDQIPGAGIPDVVQETMEQVSELESIDTDIPEIPADLQKLNTDVPQLSIGLEKGTEVLDVIQNGDVQVKADEALESAVSERNEVLELNKAEQQLTKQQQEYQALIQRYRDKKALQESIKRKAEGIVNEKFNKTSAAVLEAQERVARLRRKSSFNIRNVLTSNSLKDKPFRDRFLPGIAFTSYNSEAFTLETMLQAAYRFSGRFTVGAGSFAHFSFDRANSYFVDYEKVYGYRTFVDIGLVKGYFVRAEHEFLRKPASLNPSTHSEVPALAENNTLAGVGRRFNVSKRFRGVILVVYKIDSGGPYPAASRLNIRTGLDLNLKKRKKIG